MQKLGLGKQQNNFYSKCTCKTICSKYNKTDDSCRKVGGQTAPCRDVMNADTYPKKIKIQQFPLLLVKLDTENGH